MGNNEPISVPPVALAFENTSTTTACWMSLGFAKALGQELTDIRNHWAEWRFEWENKLAQNEVQFLRSVADLQAGYQHRGDLMDANYRDVVRAQHRDFEGALVKGALAKAVEKDGAKQLDKTLEQLDALAAAAV